MVALANIIRRKTTQVKVGNIFIGSDYPVRVQSMADTATSDIEGSVEQVIDLARAGSEVVRLTVNNEESARAIPVIKEKLIKKGFDTPLVGDFHYNGHLLLTKFPECAQALDKYRVNPGNVGFGEKQDPQFRMIIEQAIKYDKPVRIGVNWGSIDQDLTLKLMDENSKLSNPKSADEILREALIISALTSADKAIEYGLPKNNIIISCKVSRVQDLVVVYRELAKKCDFPLHLGLTEAGMGSKGIVASATALGIILQEGIGDTIRVSLTPEVGAKREKEVIVAQEILQALGIRAFIPQVSSCPGCGRTTSSYFRELAESIQNFIRIQMPEWKKTYAGVEDLKVAVMGCIVNGPGESKHADIGISLPGSGESPVAPVFIDGKKAHTLRGDNIAEEFKQIMLNYIESKYKSGN